MMRRLLAVAAILSAILSPALLPVTAGAQYDPLDPACANGGAGSPLCDNGGGNDPIAGRGGVLIRVTSLLALVAGIVSVIFLTWGGFKYITSNGDSNSVSSAKSTIIAALIGLVIAALARPIVNFVVGRL